MLEKKTGFFLITRLFLTNFQSNFYISRVIQLEKIIIGHFWSDIVNWWRHIMASLSSYDDVHTSKCEMVFPEKDKFPIKFLRQSEY